MSFLSTAATSSIIPTMSRNVAILMTVQACRDDHEVFYVSGLISYVNTWVPQDDLSYLRDTRMRLTKIVTRQDPINFQNIQARTSLILQMETMQDEEKIRTYPGMAQNFDLTIKSMKRNSLNDYVQCTRGIQGNRGN